MKKLIIVVFIVLVIAGGIINAITDIQVREGAPVTDIYLKCSNCLQTIIWIIISLISGIAVLLNSVSIAKWLDNIYFRKRPNLFAIRLLGVFMLATIPLSTYSLTTNCGLVCLTFFK